MHLFVMRFQIPNTKVSEFNLALDRLVKWPLFVLRGIGIPENHKEFQLVRRWDTKVLLKKDFESAEYENLMGAIKVLGEIKESHLYEAVENKQFLEEYGTTF